MHVYMIYEFSAMLLAPDTLVAKPHTENQPNNICSAVVLDHLSLSSLSLSLSVAGSVCRTVFFLLLLPGSLAVSVPEFTPDVSLLCVIACCLSAELFGGSDG